MSNEPQNSGQAVWGSKFGYLMVAAGAAIGLGNIWKFPYLAYRGGGGVFLVVYIIVVALLAKPMVEIETTIGRKARADAVTAYEESCGKKTGWIGWMGNIATIMICAYYFVVGGWVLKYGFQFLISGDFRITQEHGRWFEKDGIRYIATYHPSALLRDVSKRPEAFEDFVKIRRAMEELSKN